MAFLRGRTGWWYILGVSLASIARVLVGPPYKVSHRIEREPTKMMVMVVEGIHSMSNTGLH